MTEREAFVSLALQLRRQWHQHRRWAAEARAQGKPAQALADRAARYLVDARWYLAKAMDRPFILNLEN